MVNTAFDPFGRLGLPGRFALSGADLEHAYLAASRAVHPDHHANAGSAALAASETAAAEINVAYATLRDPFRRAEALLTLRGGPSAEQVKDQPAEFLMAMMDYRERFEAGDVSVVDEVESEREKVLAKAGDLLDAGVADGRVRKLLNAVKTMQSLLRERDG
jgi:molecular chaperone HscB